MERKILRLAEVVVLPFLLSLSVSSTVNLTVEKVFSKYELTGGDVVEVRVSVLNHGDEELREASVIDAVPQYLEVRGSPSYGDFSRFAAFDGINLNASENATFTYNLSVGSVPAFLGRSFMVTPAAVRDQYGRLHYSNNLKIRFPGESRNCNFNFRCEKEDGENYAKCPQDCFSGSSDGYCDQKADERCDPDCLQGSDADCLVQSSGTCGNGVCDGFESKLSCPQDCVLRETTSTTLKGIQAVARKVDRTTVASFFVLVVLAVSVILLVKAKHLREQQARVRREASEQETINKLKRRLQDGEDPAKLVGEGYAKRLVDEAGRQIWKR